MQHTARVERAACRTCFPAPALFFLNRNRNILYTLNNRKIKAAAYKISPMLKGSHPKTARSVRPIAGKICAVYPCSTLLELLLYRWMAMQQRTKIPVRMSFFLSPIRGKIRFGSKNGAFSRGKMHNSPQNLKKLAYICNPLK